MHPREAKAWLAAGPPTATRCEASGPRIRSATARRRRPEVLGAPEGKGGGEAGGAGGGTLGDGSGGPQMQDCGGEGCGLK